VSPQRPNSIVAQCIASVPVHVAILSFSRSFWWEVVSMLQRTTLTGWLLLLDNSLQILRLVSAICISIMFLVAILLCRPYKSKADFATAAGTQILLVCIFMGGLIVRLYQDIALDTAGSPELAYRLLGLRSADDAVVIMIIFAFLMTVVLGITLVGESYLRFVQQRNEAKFSVATMDPPCAKWRVRTLYACFLSHYKMGEPPRLCSTLIPHTRPLSAAPACAPRHGPQLRDACTSQRRRRTPDTCTT
jgi:hypothetical protein